MIIKLSHLPVEEINALKCQAIRSLKLTGKSPVGKVSYPVEFPFG